MGQGCSLKRLGWGQRCMGVGLDTDGWRGGSLGTMCCLQGPVVLPGVVAWAHCEVVPAPRDGGRHGKAKDRVPGSWAREGGSEAR